MILTGKVLSVRVGNMKNGRKAAVVKILQPDWKSTGNPEEIDVWYYAPSSSGGLLTMFNKVVENDYQNRIVILRYSERRGLYVGESEPKKFGVLKTNHFIIAEDDKLLDVSEKVSEAYTAIGLPELETNYRNPDEVKELIRILKDFKNIQEAKVAVKALSKIYSPQESVYIGSIGNIYEKENGKQSISVPFQDSPKDATTWTSYRFIKPINAAKKDKFVLFGMMNWIENKTPCVLCTKYAKLNSDYTEFEEAKIII